ncbi:hypothetical protein E4U58_001474, partial [Claviceps cyperi]
TGSKPTAPGYAPPDVPPPCDNENGCPPVIGEPSVPVTTPTTLMTKPLQPTGVNGDGASGSNSQLTGGNGGSPPVITPPPNSGNYTVPTDGSPTPSAPVTAGAAFVGPTTAFALAVAALVVLV